MMTTARTDAKDRLILNQSPYPSKDKVLSYTIPVDHSDALLFCQSGSSSNSSTSSNGVNSNQDASGSLNFIPSDDDPCNGRDSLASFLDEGLGTSLDGVDEISSPIFPTLGRNDSGVFSSDEATRATTPATAPRPSKLPVEVIWKNTSGNGATATTNQSILLSPSGATATIAVVTDSLTGIPSIICTSTPAPLSVPLPPPPPVTSPPSKCSDGGKMGKSSSGGSPKDSQRSKVMPVGRQGPQKCTICDKVFSNASALTKHKLTHSDERRHACATCGKAFKRQDHLNGHMLTHRNKKPFECKSKGCGKSYCDARSLRRHVENRHGHEVLESMNLASHKHSSKRDKSSKEAAPEPQPEMQVSPLVKQESVDSPKLAESMPVLQPEPEEVAKKQQSTKPPTSTPPNPAAVLSLSPPILKKLGESRIPPGVPIMVKRENVSVFDFDENIDDGGGGFGAPQLLHHQDKILPNTTIKVNGIIDSTKLASLTDIRVLQEWTKRMGDSKIALFLASPSTSSIAQITGTMTTASFQLADSQPNPTGGQSAVTMSSSSHSFLPATENGIFSVTPISLVPTSTGELAFKHASLSPSPKPIYILPPEPLSHPSPPKPVKESPPPAKTSKKPPIGSSLASRIKSKLKSTFIKKSKPPSPKPCSPIPSPAPQKASLPTITISGNTTTSTGGIVTWCAAPELIKEDPDDDLTPGDPEDKPVECSICCRRFKNTPALNGHMRLHGGYFKKETEGPKKKENVKESSNSAPLQTASVSVRALIEEKIKERRNNLLKLAAEKAAEGEKKGETKLAQQPQQLRENVKLKMEPTCSTEKDKNCDSGATLITPPQGEGAFGVFGRESEGIRGESTVHHLPQQQQEQPQPQILDKGGIMLDCGLNADDLCQAFHLIYVDGGMGGNGSGGMLFPDQDALGKMSKLFQEPVHDLLSLPDGLLNHQTNLKNATEPLVISHSQSTDDICNLPWEWRSSSSADNTDNSLNAVQDCVNSLLCSNSSVTDTPDEASSKDPVPGGGGYCYTPILSPNSSFCLTPGPDSPFEAVAPPNQSLSFICPSPSIGSVSTYSSDPSISSLVNPPSSVEPIFSPDQSQAPPPPTDLSSIYINSYDGLQIPQLPKSPYISVSLAQDTLECLPSINTFPSMQTNGAQGIGNDFTTTPQSTSLQQDQAQQFFPFEVYTTLPLPKKISEKWLDSKFNKGKRSRVGSDFQADVPPCRTTKAKNKQYRSLDDKLWDPCILDNCSLDEVDNFLEFACCSAVPGGGMNKEYALHLLTFSKGNIREALLRLMEKLPSLPAKLRTYSYAENERWSSEEMMNFQLGLIQLGKDFVKISKSVGTKTPHECVCFYYFWKKVCPSEYQVMKQMWKDRVAHQTQQLLPHQQHQPLQPPQPLPPPQQQQLLNESASFLNYLGTNLIVNGTNNDVSFLVPAQEFRAK